MKARYSYRIYPTQVQQGKLSQLFGCTRVVWNDALAVVKATPEGQKWPSSVDLIKAIARAKKTPERSWLADVSSVPLQQSVRDLGLAFSAFFDSRSGKRKGRKVGFPRFKKRTNAQSARFTKAAFAVSGNQLFLAKMGLFKVKWSRALPSEPSSVTVTMNTAGQYHVSFVVEVCPISVEPLRPSIGVDLGIATFAFLSTGERIESPGYQQLDQKIRRFQKHLSRQVRDSNRYQATRLKIAKLKLKIRNLRKDFLHKTSTQLIRENQTVSLEDLCVSGMVKNRKLARAISEQGWSAFRAMCESKAERVIARTVSIISRWEPTSQICSDCRFRWGKLDLSVRSVLCVSCGAEQDRDLNAARNIESSGLELAHDIKRTVRARQSGLPAMPVDPSSQPYEGQLTLCF
jgi:putative transposase